MLVRCFRDKHKFDEEIVEKLGSSFSRVPFVVVVVSKITSHPICPGNIICSVNSKGVTFLLARTGY